MFVRLLLVVEVVVACAGIVVAGQPSRQASVILVTAGISWAKKIGFYTMYCDLTETTVCTKNLTEYNNTYAFLLLHSTYDFVNNVIPCGIQNVDVILFKCYFLPV